MRKCWVVLGRTGIYWEGVRKHWEATGIYWEGTEEQWEVTGWCWEGLGGD